MMNSVSPATVFDMLNLSESGQQFASTEKSMLSVSVNAYTKTESTSPRFGKPRKHLLELDENTGPICVPGLVAFSGQEKKTTMIIPAAAMCTGLFKEASFPFQDHTPFRDNESISLTVRNA